MVLFEYFAIFLIFIYNFFEVSCPKIIINESRSTTFN